MFKLNPFGFANARVAVHEVESGRALLFDVRTPTEFVSGHAVGAQNAPLEQITVHNLPLVDPATAIYVYCRSGSRSAKALTLLSGMGFTNVKNLGGLHHWVTAGGPVE